jgi:hypothetical protein
MTLFLYLFLQFASLVASNQPAICTINSSSKLWIEGTSNVKGFSCFNESIISEPPKHIVFEKTSEGYLFKNLKMRIPGEHLDCGNRIMNKDLQKALLCEDYPFIELTLNNAVILPTYDEKPMGQLWEVSGHLSIAGTSRKVKLLVESQNLSSSSIHLKSKYGLMMSNYGITAPEPMMGLVKVHDKIVIHFDLILSMAIG